LTKGDIVLVSFPFTDALGAKNRPAIVLVETEFDTTVCFLTSKTKWSEEYDVTISPTPTNGLKKQSLARVTKIATLDKELILGRLGSLDAKIILDINKSLIKAFKLDI